MHKAAWIIVASLLPFSVTADAWSNALSDFEMFNAQLQEDVENIQHEIQSSELESMQELFPVLEGEEFDPNPDYALSETHVTIKVDGIPVILNDVPIFEWFAAYVRDAAERGLVSGYKNLNGLPSGNYGPADSVTIAQLAKMSVIAAGLDVYACGDELKNEGALGDWSERFVRCAEVHNWAVYNDGSVDIFRRATRGEVVVTVLQAFAQRISPRTGTVFEDVKSSAVYGAAIETAANDGIVSGYNDKFGNPTGHFGPDDAVNRAEVAKIFSLAFQVYGT